jgi:hypothetical protein
MGPRAGLDILEKKPFVPAGIQIPGPTARSLVAIVTTQVRLLYISQACRGKCHCFITKTIILLCLR